jgi:hypothetical protein
MSSYMISRAGEQFGPYNEEDLRAYLGSRQVLPEDLAWTEGMAEWLPVSQIFPSGASSSVAPPPPAFRQQNQGFVPASVPAPPGLHWGLVVLFGVLTGGIFILVWVFIQQNWIKRIAPETETKGLVSLIGYVLFTIGYYIAYGTDHAVIALVFWLILTALLYFWVFASANAMRRYYNQVEPIGLKLSNVMLIFFNMIYLQHHMHRIANWKKTGSLTSQ